MVALQLQQPVINKKALAWTIGVHALLLLLFILIHYTIAPPPPPAIDGGGLEVALGTTENGSGKDHPMSKKDPADYRAAVVFKSPPEKSPLPKDIVKTNEADAPELKEPSKKKGKVDEKEKEKPKPQQAKPKYTYGGDHGPGGNGAQDNEPGKNSGTGTGAGNQGVPGGTAGAGGNSGLPGDGSGGIGHNLSGRSISPKKFEAEFHEGGKVVIHVTVDRNGNIIDKRVKSSSSPQLTKIALEKLSNAKFSKSEGPEPQQFGDVTITFITRQ